MKHTNQDKPARRRILTTLVVVGVLAFSVALLGCGQKGSLYLPDDAEASYTTK